MPETNSAGRRDTVMRATSVDRSERCDRVFPDGRAEQGSTPTASHADDAPDAKWRSTTKIAENAIKPRGVLPSRPVADQLQRLHTESRTTGKDASCVGDR